MGYGTMYKNMQGPSSGAQKAMGFAGNVKAGRQAKEDRMNKVSKDNKKAGKDAAKMKKGNPLASMSPHIQPAQTKFTSQAKRGALSGAVNSAQTKFTSQAKTKKV